MTLPLKNREALPYGQPLKFQTGRFLGRAGYEFKGKAVNLESYVSGPVTDTLGLRLAVRCDNTESAEKLRAYFQGKPTNAGATQGGIGEWATLEIPADPQAAFQSIKGMLDDAGR